MVTHPTRAKHLPMVSRISVAGQAVLAATFNIPCTSTEVMLPHALVLSSYLKELHGTAIPLSAFILSASIPVCLHPCLPPSLSAFIPSPIPGNPCLPSSLHPLSVFHLILQIHSLYHNRTGYSITGHTKDFSLMLRTSKFCLSSQVRSQACVCVCLCVCVHVYVLACVCACGCDCAICGCAICGCEPVGSYSNACATVDFFMHLHDVFISVYSQKWSSQCVCQRTHTHHYAGCRTRQSAGHCSLGRLCSSQHR